MASVIVGVVEITGDRLVGMEQGYILKMDLSVDGVKKGRRSKVALNFTNKGEEEVRISRTRGKQVQKKRLKPGATASISGFEHLELHGNHSLMVGGESLIVMC